MEDKKWLVFYTRSRAEKKVRDNLLKNGFEVFLPLQKVVRQWSDRKKKVEVPFFNSYIFVRDEVHRIPDILQVPGISWNIRLDGKPAVLSNKDYQTIKQILDTGFFVDDAIDRDIDIGSDVEVQFGPLKGLTGTLSEGANGKFIVVLDSIDKSISVNVNSELLKKV